MAEAGRWWRGRAAAGAALLAVAVVGGARPEPASTGVGTATPTATATSVPSLPPLPSGPPVVTASPSAPPSLPPGAPRPPAGPTPRPGVYRYRVVSGEGEDQEARVYPAARVRGGWEVRSRAWEADASPRRFVGALRRFTKDGVFTLRTEDRRGDAPQVCVYDRPVRELMFPLRIGAAWETRARCDGADHEELVRVYVLAEEEVRIGGYPVRTFQLQRITYAGNTVSTSYRWYAPDWKLYVRQRLGITQRTPDGYTLEMRSLRPRAAS